MNPAKGRAEELVERMRQRFQPTPEDRARLDTAVRDILRRANEVGVRLAAEVPLFDPLLVGSAAKDTWIPRHVDLDLFLLFDPTLPRETLEEAGLRIGKEILPEWHLRYAEHPYVHGVFDGFNADVVPAYKVPDAKEIRSAVDRTPFHNRYVRAAVEADPRMKDEIRLAKAWLRGIGAYGAETALGGVSGYLSEVLVLNHGGFLDTVAAMSTWRSGHRIDPAAHSQTAFPGDALVVIDPVDPGRNAASAVRADRFARIVHAATSFLDAPSERFFDPVAPAPLDADTAERLLGARGLAVVRLALPDMREEARGPHLRRAAESLGSRLQRDGFAVERADGDILDGSAYLIIITSTAELPETRLHLGPPLHVRDRVAEFRAKHEGNPDTLRGPMEIEIEGKPRIAVELRVHHRSVVERVRGVLASGAPLGKHIDKALAGAPAEVMEIREAIRRPGFERMLADALCPVPPWERTGEAARDYALAA